MNNPISKDAPLQPTPAELIQGSPVVVALDVLPDRWSWLIMRDLFLGFHRFEELKRRTGAARGTLTARLNSLVEKGLLYRNPYQNNPTRYEYRLTDKAFGLYPCALMIWAWETRWTSEHDQLPATLLHRSCNKTTCPQLCCEACGEVIVATDVVYSATPSTRVAAPRVPGPERRRRPKSSQQEGVDTSFFHALDIVGDRWTGMILAALWFNVHRYDDIATAIGIATNILSDRLKTLTDAGVLERRPYRENPTRHDYRLTEKGRAIYGFTLTLHQWANKWLVGKAGSNLSLTHSCGKPLVGIVTCDQCGDPLERASTSFKNSAA